MLSDWMQKLQNISEHIVKLFKQETPRQIQPFPSYENSVFAGTWSVFFNDELIADLEYLYDDQPVHVFKLKVHTSDISRVDYALNSSRRKSEDMILYNIKQNLMLKEEYFFAHTDGDGKVSVRVFGPILNITP